MMKGIIDGFEWVWMESLRKNIQLILVLLKAPFLVLHFYYATPMTFLMILSVISLYTLMILLSTLTVIRHLICGNKAPRLDSDLPGIADWAATGLLISLLEKFNLFHLIGLIH